MYPEMKVSALNALQKPLAFPSVLGQHSCWSRVSESSPEGHGDCPSLHSLRGTAEQSDMFSSERPRKTNFTPPSAPFSWCLPQKSCFPGFALNTEGPLQGLARRGSTSPPFPPALPILEPCPAMRPAPACSQAPVPSATCPGASLTSAAVLQSSSGLSPRGRREELSQPVERYQASGASFKQT